MAALGFADDAAGTFERAGPYLVRGAADLIPTSKLLDDYRGMILCTIRNYHDVGPAIARALGGDNGFSLRRPAPCSARATRSSIPTTCRG